MEHREHQGRERQGYKREEDYGRERPARGLDRSEFNHDWEEQGPSGSRRYWGRERQDWQQPGYGRIGERRFDRDWERQESRDYGYDRERPSPEWEPPGSGYESREEKGSGVHAPSSQRRQGYPNEDTGYSSSGYGGPLFALGDSGRYGQSHHERSQYESSQEYQGLQRNAQRGPHAGRGPKGYQRSDERIREDVCDRLTEHPAIDASEIEVEVKGLK